MSKYEALRSEGEVYVVYTCFYDTTGDKPTACSLNTFPKIYKIFTVLWLKKAWGVFCGNGVGTYIKIV